MTKQESNCISTKREITEQEEAEARKAMKKNFRFFNRFVQSNDDRDILGFLIFKNYF